MSNFYHYYQDVEPFDCPVCGLTILPPNAEFMGPQCDHLKWLYLDDYDFQYLDPSFRRDHPKIVSEIGCAIDGPEDSEDGDDGHEAEMTGSVPDRLSAIWSGQDKFVVAVHDGTGMFVAYLGFVGAMIQVPGSDIT